MGSLSFREKVTFELDLREGEAVMGEKGILDKGFTFFAWIQIKSDLGGCLEVYHISFHVSPSPTLLGRP